MTGSESGQLKKTKKTKKRIDASESSLYRFEGSDLERGKKLQRTLKTAQRKTNNSSNEELLTSLSCLKGFYRLSSDKDGLISDKDQANKSTGWMPWHRLPMKDVVSCEKLRGAASRHRSEDLRMGKPGWGNTQSP